MTNELYWLTLTALVMALCWTPYVVNRLTLQGFLGAMQNPSAQDPQPPEWASRAKAAHGIAVENFAVFAALILIAHLTDTSNTVTSTAAALYFFGMLAHYLVFTLGLPYLRTLAFVIAGLDNLGHTVPCTRISLRDLILGFGP